MSNLTQRVLTAIVTIPILLWLIVKGGLPFTLLVGAATIIGLYEFFAMMEARGFKPMKEVGYALGAAYIAVAYFSNEYYLTVLVTFSALAVMVVQLSRKDVQASITGMAVTVLGLFYVPWLFSHAVLLRNIGAELLDKIGVSGRATGIIPLGAGADEYAFVMGFFFVLFAIACTFLNDTGAYFAGRFYGKHRLAPTISPKKTWEGAIGGVVTAMVGALIIRAVFDLWIPNGDMVKFGYLACLLLGAAIAVIGGIGDLVESLIKRDADIKDSGSLLPGHGGMLDRVDALLFTFPLTYYVVKIYFMAKA